MVGVLLVGGRADVWKCGWVDEGIRGCVDGWKGG